MSKKALLFALLILIAISCKAQPNNQTFEISTKYISTNYNSRVRQIVLHYTAKNFETSLNILDGKTKRRVSSHYLINDNPTKEYPYYIYNLVPDDDRSWDAGVSTWRGDVDLNNSSIGIEIVNLNGNKDPYPERQIEAVIFLVKKLLDMYDVLPVDIVGHSDIAPTRKDDPGIYFPWKQLFNNGIGAWYDDKDIEDYKKKVTELPSIAIIKQALYTYGYKINLNNPNIDEEYTAVVKAFQRHFSPSRVDGVMSLENYIILKSLLKKYNSLD